MTMSMLVDVDSEMGNVSSRPDTRMYIMHLHFKLSTDFSTDRNKVRTSCIEKCTQCVCQLPFNFILRTRATKGACHAAC